ncbi:MULTISPECIES: isochorismatase family protein [unclassified Rhizobium]|jgi:nicotinamidase-related amidase|uniref:isochorismatase family protein n=1 Tax=unclassified Rhizobium TaxID=2613769 RepID=UPI000645F995|nr:MULTISPECIES: isochorismatase family protein [unclassified Rhizobium]MBN8953160.1 isochorismatase family protein [Rhizobium tropici]OJY75720.1 MAG: hydrolase [Rhizobium sp. 60-20]RKD75065.1 nicotinamidase-related amidase [Rhizobium sp. WW_1]
MPLYDPKTTALVSIDLQGLVLGRQLAPYSAQQVIANTVAIANKLKADGGTTVFVTVGFSADYADAVNQPTDESFTLPPGGLPAAALEAPPEMAALTPDVAIIKRQWSAFYGTELDLQLRRRGIKTLILTGVATNFGVESTVRDGYAANYAVIVAEDATATFSQEMQDFACTKVLPRLSRIRKTAEILAN